MPRSKTRSPRSTGRTAMVRPHLIVSVIRGTPRMLVMTPAHWHQRQLGALLHRLAAELEAGSTDHRWSIELRTDHERQRAEVAHSLLAALNAVRAGLAEVAS